MTRRTVTDRLSARAQACRPTTYLLAWRAPETGQVRTGRLGFESRDLAEYTAKTLNRARPEVEHWVEIDEDRPAAEL